MEVDAPIAQQLDEQPVSPTTKNSQPERPQSPAISPTDARRIPSLGARADPDAQATVTDYLDFTEYLPSDMMRSLTLIGKLDETYNQASLSVHELTRTWGVLPTLPADQRPASVKLRKDISENVNRAVSSRVFSHAEACRMRDNVNRHYNRAKTILAKLQTMRENWPTAEEEAKSPVLTRSPLATRAPKITFHVDSNGQKVRGPPRITVPGEVLAPYEIDFNVYSDTGDDSSDDDVSPGNKATPGPRIRLVKTPKVPKLKVPKPPRPPRTPLAPGQVAPMSTSSALAALEPPPENAVVGGEHAPWLQLTPYELAKLRKRMKKNAVWNPSDTMIARELKLLGRGVEAYKTAQKHAEANGLPFEDAVPATVTDVESGAQHPAAGAISAETLTADEIQLSNRGMKLNEAKKLKREALAKMAAEEAEESARKMNEAARMFLGPEGSPSVSIATVASGDNKALVTKKRKRDSAASEAPVLEKAVETPESQLARPLMKRTKTETPIPPPQLSSRTTSVPPANQTPIPVPQFAKTTTVLPVAKSFGDSVASAVKPVNSVRSVTSPVPPPSFTSTIPIKPAAESPVLAVAKPSTTPILPPVREMPKRETRQHNLQPMATNPQQATSRQVTPVPAPPVTVVPPTNTGSVPTTAENLTTTTITRRPTSRGKGSSQEPPNILVDRPRRTSTARNTPAPELRQASKRTKRPAPGVVTTNPGGTSAVGKRKAAPRKKSRGSNASAKREKGVNGGPGTANADGTDVDVEIDDDGNVVDPNEPRYCLCNRVSFGTMIQCDNVDVSNQKSTSSSNGYVPSTSYSFHLDAFTVPLVQARHVPEIGSVNNANSTSPHDIQAQPSRRSKRILLHERDVKIKQEAEDAAIQPHQPQNLQKKTKLTASTTQNCKQEWFHLECVGLSAIPARTTKWYCPDCRVALNIGGKGEVTSRGVRT